MGKIKLYSEMLGEIFSEYEGDYKDLLKKIPIYFNILQKIYSSDELTWEAKFKINSCFSYFAIPLDLIPDEGPEGYLDDLFICVYVLNDLITQYEYLFDGIIEIDKLEIEKILSETTELLGNKTSEILNFTGLIKFNEMSEDPSFLKAPENINQKTERIKDEIISLIGLLRTVFIVEGKTPKGRYLRHLKELFKDDEWDKVLNILENLEIHESGFDYTHELELEKIKRKVILEVNEELLSD